MNVAESLRSNAGISVDQMLKLNGIMAERMHSAIVSIILRCYAEDCMELQDICSVADEICRFVIGIRNEIPMNPDDLKTDLPF